MPKTICIDPGHGGRDPGAISASRHEVDDNLRLAYAVEKHLTKQRQKVVLTHRGNIAAGSKLELPARSGIANNCKADLFISLHRNSAQKVDAKGNPMFSGGLPVPDPTANGVEIWTRYNASIAAASDVYDAVLASCALRPRGMKIGNYLVLHDLTMPGMLLEFGFVSNTGDNVLFDQRLSQNAEGIAKGILTALGEPWDDMSATPYWRVQVGAFKSRENAVDYLASIQAAGLPAFIVEYEADDLYRVQVGAFGIKTNAESFLQTVRNMGLPAFLVVPGAAR